MQKYLVLGASPKQLRPSNKAVRGLLRHNKEVIPVGYQEGMISGKEILTGTPDLDDIDTILIYVGTSRLDNYHNYIIGLKPQKVVFNPGTESPEFQRKLERIGIEVIVGCSLVMINTGEI